MSLIFYLLQLEEERARQQRPVTSMSASTQATSSSSTDTTESSEEEEEEEEEPHKKRKKSTPRHPPGYTPLRESGWYYKGNRRRRRANIEKEEDTDEYEEPTAFEPVVEFKVPRPPPPSRCGSSDEDTKRLLTIVPSVVQYRDLEDMDTVKRAVRDPRWYYGHHKRPVYARRSQHAIVRTANNSDVEISDTSVSSTDTDPTEPCNTPTEPNTPQPIVSSVVPAAARQIDQIRHNPRYYYSQSVRRRRQYLQRWRDLSSESGDSDTDSIFDEAKVIMADKTKDTRTKWREIQKRIDVRYGHDEVSRWRIVYRMREMMTHRFTTTFKRWWDEEIERKRRDNMMQEERKPVNLAETIRLKRRVRGRPGEG